MAGGGERVTGAFVLFVQILAFLIFVGLLIALIRGFIVFGRERERQ